MPKNKHLTLDDRVQISSMLDKGCSFKAIGASLEKSCTSISREVRNHLVFQKTGGYGRPYNACKKRVTCDARLLCKDCTLPQSHNRCSLCRFCNGHCPDFEKEECPLLERPPYVCNSCKKRASCTLEKRIYKATNAQEEYTDTLKSSRTGITLAEDEVGRLDKIISPLVLKGQSIHHICVNNKDALMVSESTIYRLIDSNLFAARNIDLPRKVRFSARKTKKRLKIDKSCRVGRDYRDYQAYIAEHPDLPVVEMDSVEGSKGGKVLLTIHFVKAELMVAFLRETNDSQSVLDIFDRLYLEIGPDNFVKIMPIILTDNGSEFSNPVRIEQDRQENPRTKVFYCDPSSPEQKGSAERNHELIRYCVPKGKSMDFLTQEMVDHMMDNINSLSRKSLGDKCPYEAFAFLYGEDVLRRLNCHRIPANEVTLKPTVFDKFLKTDCGDVSIIH